jgi:hypothetical protein
MQDLDSLFSAYREAVPDPEPSAGFTPGVWARIEARRSPVRFFRRMAEAFVTVAAVATILIGLFLMPRLQNSVVYSATYVDVLADEQSEVQYAELLPRAVVPERPSQ